MVSQSARRFLKYTIIGGSTFAFDLVLLFIFVDVLHFNNVLSAGIAFLIAVSINYFISRTVVFKGTSRDVRTGYVYFLIIAGIGLAFVMGSMFVLVNILELNYLLSRICIAGITGFFNYLTNLYFNFKIAGKH